MKSNMRVLVGLVAVMWAVEVLNGFMGHSLNEYGILPRTTGGLIGIPMSPFLHAGIGHVLSNTIPLLALGSLTVLQVEERLRGHDAVHRVRRRGRRLADRPVRLSRRRQRASVRLLRLSGR